MTVPLPDWRPGLRLLREALRGSRRPLLRVAFWSAVEAAPALASGLVLATALDHGFLAGRPAAGIGWLTLLAGLYAVRALAERSLFMPLADIVEPLRDTLVRHVVRGTLHDAVRHGRAADAAGVSRLTSQVDGVRGIVGALLRTARPLAVTLIAALLGLATLDPLLAGLVAVPLVAAVAVFLVTMRAVTRRRLASLLAEEELATATASVLAAGRDITALGAEERAAADVRRAADRSVAAALDTARASAVRAPVILVGGHLPALLVLLCGPSLVARGHVSAGAVVGAVLYVTAYLVPALQLMTGTVAGYWSQLRVLTGRLAGVPAVPKAPQAAAEPAPEGELVLRGLSFAYGPHAEPVLRDLDLVVPPGDHLAVVGPSGIGKSTLAGLLAGVERPTSGTVTLAGRPVRAGMLALLPQEAYVFPGTLRENLGYLAPGLDTETLLRSATAVGAAELVARLGGPDAELTDPAGSLSSGERQLIALARVHASPARVVVLDEATCHLDMAAEAAAEAAFAARPGTLIIIAHRLTTALRARRVLLLDGGRPVLGSHTDLLAASPAYASLVGHWTAPDRQPAP